MGQITSLFVHKVIAQAPDSLDKRALLSSVGLDPDAAIDPTMLAAIGAAAATTIFLATVLRMPTSTTHALTGALVGAGWTAAGATNVNWSVLATKFAQPLLLSPFLAIGAAALIYPALRAGRVAAGIDRNTCLCVGGNEVRRFGMDAGWVDYKIAAIDEVWSGLCFSRRSAKPPVRSARARKAGPPRARRRRGRGG